jgi:hypothetical protein
MFLLDSSADIAWRKSERRTRYRKSSSADYCVVWDIHSKQMLQIYRASQILFDAVRDKPSWYMAAFGIDTPVLSVVFRQLRDQNFGKPS